MYSFESEEIVNYVSARKTYDNRHSIEFVNEKCEDMEEVMQNLKKYLLRRTSQTGQYVTIPVKYKFGKGKIKGLQGRQIAVYGGLQSLQREVRQTICHEIYDDIDMNNAIGCILIGFCETNKINCDGIKHYVKNRDECLGKFMSKYKLSRDNAKKALIKILLGGGKFLKIKKTGETIEYENDQLAQMLYDDSVKIKNFLKTSEKYKSELDLVIKRRTKQGKAYNFEGSLLADIIFTEENKLLMKTINFLKKEKKSIKNIVLIFDGFQIPKTENCTGKDFLINLSEFVSKDTNYNIIFSKKEMTDMIDITKYDVNPDLDAEFEHKKYYCSTNTQCADIILDLIQNKVKNCADVIWMKRESIGVWTDDLKRIKNEIIDSILSNDFWHIDAKKGQLNKSYRDAEDIYKTIINKLFVDKKYRDDDFYFNIVNKIKNKIFFKDGYIELIDNGKWINRYYKDLQEEDKYTFVRINRKIPDFKKVTENAKKDLNDRILKPILGDETSVINYLSHYARAITANFEDKQGVITCSERDSGKGVITLLVKNTFGKYVGEISSDHFIIERMRAAHDAKKYAFLYEKRHCHILIANESTTGIGKNDIYWDGAVFKRFLSGGDTVEIRPLYENETCIKPHFRIFVMCNDVPPIKPADALTKLSIINFPHKFISEDEFNDIKEKLKEENAKLKTQKKALIKLNPNLRLTDPNIKSVCERSDVCDAFLLRVLESYKKIPVVDCPKVKQMTKDLILDMGEENAVINSMFQYTGLESDHVVLTDLRDALNENELLAIFNITKLKQKLRHIGGIESNHIKIPSDDGKDRNARGFTHIRMKVSEDENKGTGILDLSKPPPITPQITPTKKEEVFGVPPKKTARARKV